MTPSRQWINREQFFVLVEEVARTERWSDIDRIHWAYSLAKNYHRPQMRRGGNRYFDHCKAVALLLMQQFGPTRPLELIIALLHDAYEDQFMPQGMLEHLFGHDAELSIYMLSHRRPKFRERGLVEKVSIPVDHYFMDLMAAPRETRRVKVADRIHNLQTLSACSVDAQRRKLDETRRYVYPLAQVTDHRMYIALQSLVTQCEAAL